MMPKMGSCRVEEEVQESLMRRGPWTAEEDMILFRCVSLHGEGRWNTIAKYAGLRRTGKSCRLRWLNYLSPAVKRGNITVEEQLLILELHGKWGNRWSRIAKHLPGRTDNEIKNYWRTRMKKVHAHYIVMNNSFSALPSPATAINTLGIQEQRGGGFHCNEIGRNCEDGGEKWKSPMVSTTHDANITDEDFRRYSAAEAVNSCSSGLAAINSSESELSALTTETATFDVEIDWPHVINNLWRIDGMSADTLW